VSAVRWSPPADVSLLSAGLVVAVALRVEVGAPAASSSTLAGIVFALVLLALAGAVGTRTRLDGRSVAYGVAGAAILCAPVVVRWFVGESGGHRPAGSYAVWAVIVTAVALAEEAFLRGALFTAVRNWHGPVPAIVVSSLAFAGLHVPLYGWSSVGLDTAVGFVLGVLRERSGSWTAPALAHVGADLAGWWLR
jgi:membrane protease YdiL (CAAX protease family)